MGHDEWVSAHIFYHGDQDPVIVYLIRLIVEELADGGARPDFFFLRYWEGGPHVRLRVRAEPRDYDRVRRVIEARCRTFFRSCPSADAIRQEEYEKTAALLARGEGMTDFARELAPNNSVSFIPYRREYPRYGRAAMAAVEAHFVDSSRIVLNMLSEGATPKQRVTAVVAMYLIAWLRLGRTAEIAPLDADYADLFARQRDVLLPLGRRMRALVDHTHQISLDDGLAGWSRTMARLREALEADRRRLPGVMTTCAHLAANRLGVDLVSERYASSLAARTVLELCEEEQLA
ncbi:thiopeptide-type bacteriocin biosynthesis protein [Nonomuraea polychroma]|uniref:Thiopeptide-type bacteriocin biosynthesis protein n=1 Tax=Nonomuraea polychroma TaxID=46176 RepID=A0A438MGT3_9ACTN|nr:thiopeptide-type bacteriocin biosynthesis protein [Nonomuraea polychroma]RVX44993.1 thiopeptide-type bacteriocin biosynthesis protein [Nonomuraea polychroma]